MRLTIVGCGSIGRKLAEAADRMQEVKRIYLIDSEPPRAQKVADGLQKAIVVNSVEEELYHCDLVVEAASQSAALEILPKVVGRGVDIMVMSVGALVDDAFRSSVFEKAKNSGAKIMVPSGAVSGTDGLRSASMDDLASVELITTKGPNSIRDVPYLKEKGIDLKKIKEPTVIYTGTAREAVGLFPKNVNVAATVSLLGVGFDRTTVKIIVDPRSVSNSHELVIKGKFGEMVCHTTNVPSPDNPSTSHLAALSAISVLHRVVRNEWIGI
jgi:aspartate dehydrogenase